MPSGSFFIDNLPPSSLASIHLLKLIDSASLGSGYLTLASRWALAFFLTNPLISINRISNLKQSPNYLN